MQVFTKHPKPEGVVLAASSKGSCSSSSLFYFPISKTNRLNLFTRLSKIIFSIKDRNIKKENDFALGQRCLEPDRYSSRSNMGVNDLTLFDKVSIGGN